MRLIKDLDIRLSKRFGELSAFLEFKEKCLKYKSCLNIEFFEVLSGKFSSLEVVIPTKTTAYRARLYKANLLLEDYELGLETREIFSQIAKSGDFGLNSITDMAREKLNAKHDRKRFKGYNAKESFVNLDYHRVEDGRCNYKFVPCLYMANNVKTAISEIKPTIGSNVSVAKIRVLEDMKLINLMPNKGDLFINWISELFTQSVTLEFPDAYLYTQIICDFIKYSGYDGVIYPSCQVVSGINYAIFNYDKCKAISSEVYTVGCVDVGYSKRQI